MESSVTDLPISGATTSRKSDRTGADILDDKLVKEGVMSCKSLCDLFDYFGDSFEVRS